MSREKKKGTSGNAKAFITRAKALKKLQVTLPEFRRLCILKGVYPRDPKKKREGSDKTYYLRKDIDFLAHERLIGSLRLQNAHAKKVVKARSKRRIDLLKRLSLSTPKARLDHLVVERYPSFVDAIRDLDDPLCVISLFANLPADHKVGIAPDRVRNSQRLLKEFHHYVAETNSLRRVFVSIKGYYFQAKVHGELVTWITPHRFSQILPQDVDYSVMLTFLELYECILSFVNFRLYMSQNLVYPPKIIRMADANALELASIQVEKAPRMEKNANGIILAEDNAPASLSDQAVMTAEKLALAGLEEDESDEDCDQLEDRRKANDEKSGSTLLQEKSSGAEAASEGYVSPTAIFNGKSFVLGREVPYVELEFILKAVGAILVTREDDLPSGSDRLSKYTHWIVDRPKILGDRDMSLEYVQPQYVFDSINSMVVLPTSLYLPGASLPPHLSPFVTDADDGGYRPWYKDILERIKAGDSAVVEEAAAVVYAEGSVHDKKHGAIVHKEVENGSIVADTGKTSLNRNYKEQCPKSTSAACLQKGDSGDADAAMVTKAVDNLCGVDEGFESEESEEDEEGAEQDIVKGKQDKMEKEGKELATVMLSRKKMRIYLRKKKEDDAKAAVKHKLTAKRRMFEKEKEISSKPSKRRK